jgi:hypothetical protein
MLGGEAGAVCEKSHRVKGASIKAIVATLLSGQGATCHIGHDTTIAAIVEEAAKPRRYGTGNNKGRA